MFFFTLLAHSAFPSHFPPTGCGRTLGPDRISGSLFLASGTERQSGRALLRLCEKCCVSLSSAHCRVSGFRFRPARPGVSRRHNLLCPANGLRLGLWSSKERVANPAGPAGARMVAQSTGRGVLSGTVSTIASYSAPRLRRNVGLRRPNGRAVPLGVGPVSDGFSQEQTSLVPRPTQNGGSVPSESMVVRASSSF